MFDSLSQANRIIVTGLHRSGTRVASLIVGSYLQRPTIDETLIWDSWVGINAYSTWLGSCVFHGPMLVPSLLGNLQDTDAVVWVNRNISEIDASQQRIGFLHKDQACWDVLDPTIDWCKPNEEKLRIWQQQIRERLPCHVLEVQYADLQQFPRWVSAEYRKDFSWCQTGGDRQEFAWPPVLDSVMVQLRRN